MGVISEAKAAVELAKELGSYLKQAGEYDPKLMGMFEDLRGKVLSLYESDIELRQQVRELEEKLKLREEVFLIERKAGTTLARRRILRMALFAANATMMIKDSYR